MQGSRDFVLDIYDTVADSSLWPDVLDRFADMVGAKGCIVFEWQGDGEQRTLDAPHMSSRYERAKLEQYLSAFQSLEIEDQDTFERLSLESDAIDLIDDSRLFDDEATLLARPNVQAMIANDMRHRAAGLLNKDNTTRSRFSIQLSEAHGPMNAEERAKASALLPHIAKALDLGRPVLQLTAAHKQLVAAMDMLTIGVCILDSRGFIVATNREFERQYDAYRTFRRSPEGKLRFSNLADERHFTELASDPMNHGQFGARPRKEAVPVFNDGNVGALCIESVPLQQSAEMGSTIFNGAIVYSMDTSVPMHHDASALRKIFGLTEAEAALADLLSQGMTNTQIAEQRDRAVATINAQVKSLLSKTDCANRTQFVRLLANFGANFLRSAPAA